MDYIQLLGQAYKMAEQDSWNPSPLTVKEIETRIQDITDILKGAMPHIERILLAAERHELRTRLKNADDVTKRLLGISHGN